MFMHVLITTIHTFIVDEMRLFCVMISANHRQNANRTPQNYYAGMMKLERVIFM